MLFIVLLILLFIVILPAANNAKAHKSGAIGERSVSVALRNIGFEVFDNVMFVMNGRTVQIDHLAVSQKGVLVVETKNHHGVINGNAYEKEWHQWLNCEDYPFYNPVWQNYGHVKTVQSLFALPKDKVKGIVIFSSDPVLNLIEGGNLITTLLNLPNCLEKFPRDIMTPKEVERISLLIRAANISDKELAKEHIKQVEETKKEKKCA